MTSRELTSGFDFWSHVISAWSWCIFSSNLEQIPLSNPELLTMDFQVMLIWLFWRADSVVFVLCGKFGSNIRSSQWDRRTCASDVHLMTSRELTSGFDFWKCGHLRMASMHISIKNGADILIQSSYWHFPKFNMAATAVLDLHDKWISHVSAWWQTSASAIY